MVNSAIKKYDFGDIIEDSQKRLVLIIYDISNNKKRMSMVKILESYGKRVQKSAFEALLTEKNYKIIIHKIQGIIEPEDNVRIYGLNSSNEVVLLGTTDTVYYDEIIII